MVIWLFYSRQWKNVAKFCVTMSLAGVLTVVVFPAILTHIFNMASYRPELAETLNFGLYDYVVRLFIFYSYINEDLSGGLLTYFLIVVFFLLFPLGKNKWLSFKQKIIDIRDNDEQVFSWLFLHVPCVCYFALVSRIAIYNVPRYMYPIYAICFIIGVCGIWYVCNKIIKKIYCENVFGIFLLILIVHSWVVCDWRDLHLSGKESIEISKEFSDKECIFIYPEDKGNFLHSSYYEIRNYNEVTFITEEHLDILNSLSVKEELDCVVYITENCDEDFVLDKILNICPFIDQYKQISKYGSARAYYLY